MAPGTNRPGREAFYRLIRRLVPLTRLSVPSNVHRAKSPLWLCFSVEKATPRWSDSSRPCSPWRRPLFECFSVPGTFLYPEPFSGFASGGGWTSSKTTPPFLSVSRYTNSPPPGIFPPKITWKPLSCIVRTTRWQSATRNPK